MLIDIYNEVGKERERQDKKWGEQNHAPEWWMQILMEEVGEASKALLEAEFDTKLKRKMLFHYRTEMIQIAAVAIAMVESYDRNQI